MTKKPLNPKKKINKKKPAEPEGGALWEHVAASVEPLTRRHKNRTPDVEKAPLAANAKAAKAGKGKISPRPYVANADKPIPRLPELSLESQPGLDKSTAKKLKKGQQRIEGRIDLHGMTQQQAHRALDSFIDGSYGAAKRCVLVITGKGLKPDGSVGVIRSAVPRWLNEQPNRGRVLAFTHATPRDGGEGALYVMLKRKR